MSSLSTLSSEFRYATLFYYGVKKIIAWPVKCGSKDTLLRLIADACELPFDAIGDMVFRTVQNKSNGLESTNNTITSPEIGGWIKVGISGSIIPCDVILEGHVDEFTVMLDDIVSDSAATIDSNLQKYNPVAAGLLNILKAPSNEFETTPIIRPDNSTNQFYRFFSNFFSSDVSHQSSTLEYNRGGPILDKDGYNPISTKYERVKNNLKNNDSDSETDVDRVINKINNEDYNIDKSDMKYHLNNNVPSQTDFQGRSYQSQLLKFQRILAHLVNERTVLAWLRTNLAFVVIALKFMVLAKTYSSVGSTVSMILYSIGGLYMLLLPLSWYSGFDRFRRCKEMLDYDISEISRYLYKMGFDTDILALFILIAVSFLGVVVGGTIIIWYST